jgi:hypothetical protein
LLKALSGQFKTRAEIRISPFLLRTSHIKTSPEIRRQQRPFQEILLESETTISACVRRRVVPGDENPTGKINLSGSTDSTAFIGSRDMDAVYGETCGVKVGRADWQFTAGAILPCVAQRNPGFKIC